MITIKELDTIIPDIIRRLEEVSREATHYRKQNSYPKAWGLIDEIEKKIIQIKKVHEVYKSPSYAKKDFTNYVNTLESYVKECKEYCAYIREIDKWHY